MISCSQLCWQIQQTAPRIRAQSLARLLALPLCVVLWSPLSVSAQGQVLGEIHGIVKDQQGGVLPGVLVTATPTEGRAPLSATTDAAGFYSIRDVPPGEYAIRAELKAFSTIIQAGVIARAGLSLSVDLTMSLGAIGEELEVRRETPLLDTKNAATSVNISGDLRRAVPLSSTNNWATSLLLVPGLVSSEGPDQTSYSLHGSYFGSHVLQFDGADLGSAQFGIPSYVQLSTEAISDMQIKTAGVDASAPLGLGAVVNLTTSSGSNRLAGAAGFAVQPKRWNDSNTPAGSSSSLGLFQPDVSLGGPIVRDRAWFFGAYRRTEQNVGLSRTATQVATLQELVPGFEPFDNHIGSNVPFVKLTAHVRGNHQIMAFAQRDVQARDFNSETYAGNFVRLDIGGSAYAGRISSTWGSSVSTTLAVSYNDKSGPVRVLDLSQAAQNVFSSSLLVGAQRTGTGLVATLDNTDLPGTDDTSEKLTISGDATYFKQGWIGSHELKVGAQLQPYLRRRTTTIYSNDGFTLEEAVLRNAADPSAGIVPFHRRAYAAATVPSFATDSRDYALYVQDAWRPTTRLTLTAGVRIDAIEQTDGLFDVTTQDSVDVGPRLGLNYIVTGDGRNSIRASWNRVHDTVASTTATAGSSSVDVTDSYDLDLNGSFETSFTIPGATALNPNRVFDLDQWHQPYINEWTAGYRRQLPGQISVDVGWIRREYRDRAAGIEVNGIYDGGVFRGYKNQSLNQIYLVANNRWNWPVVSALDIGFSKQTARLQILGSYSREWRHLAGTWQPNDPASFIQPDAFANDKGIGPTKGNPGSATDANSLSGSQGNTSSQAEWHDHAFRLGVSYRGPLGLQIATNYGFQSGVWSGPIVTRLAAPDPQFGPSTLTLSNGRVVQNPLATPIRFPRDTRSDGQFTLPNRHSWNVRVGRETRLAGVRLTTAIDVFNLTNHDADQRLISGGNQLYNPNYGLGTYRQLPRSAQLVIRLVF